LINLLLLIHVSGSQSTPESLTISSYFLFCPSLKKAGHLANNSLHLPQNYEPDELTKEMAHLEGLMKDLNAITTA